MLFLGILDVYAKLFNDPGKARIDALHQIGVAFDDLMPVPPVQAPQTVSRRLGQSRQNLRTEVGSIVLVDSLGNHPIAEGHKVRRKNRVLAGPKSQVVSYNDSTPAIHHCSEPRSKLFAIVLDPKIHLMMIGLIKLPRVD